MIRCAPHLSDVLGKHQLSLISSDKKNTLEGFPSGQREQTVNLPAPPSMVRIRPPPPYSVDIQKSQLIELAFLLLFFIAIAPLLISRRLIIVCLINQAKPA